MTIQGYVAMSELDEGRAPPGTRDSCQAAWLQAGRTGDLTALDRLFASHTHALFVLCYGILGHAEDAEDAVQETFLRALHGLSSFREEAAFRTWLFRIAINICLRWRAGRHPTEPWDEADALTSSSSSPEIIALGRLQIMEALNTLPPHHRAILLLKEQEGWSAAEIAQAMRWNEKRVYNELYKARRALVDWRRRRPDQGERP
jgi:RNA polymerase sigma-70 factor (ECF subfamily)